MARRFLTPDIASPAAANGTDAVPPASSHLLRWHLHGSAVTKVAIVGNVVVAVLFFAVIIWRIFFTGTGTTAAQDGAAAVSPQVQQGALSSSPSASSNSSSTPPWPCASPRSAGGLGKADLLALPVFVHGAEGGEGPPVECAVCLAELRDGETGRMLPRCGHRFHAECVDRWFRLHVTCPLCRARAVVVDGGSGKSPKVQLDV